MEEQPRNLSDDSSEKPTNIWLIIFAVVLTALVAGGGVFIWQKMTAEQQKKDDVMKELVDEVDKLKKESTMTPSEKDAFTPTTPTPTPSPEPDTTPDETDPYDGWLTYISEKYDYRIRYPPGGTVSEAEKVAFSMSPEEHDLGVTFDDLYSEYTGEICVSISYKLGYVNISAPINKEKGYVLCGRTGVAYETESISESLTIEGNVYTATGIEERGPGEQLMYHNETLGVELDDGTGIEYGAAPDEVKTYADYLEIKPDLTKIVESYKAL